MFKTFYSYFALLTFTLYALSSPIIWASYFAYQEYIAATFCVNKQLPLCNGTCFINTVVEEDPKPVVPKIEVRTPEIVPALIELSIELNSSGIKTRQYHPFYTHSILHGIQFTLLKPPKPTATFGCI
jgi:hypothetical protein